MRIIIITIHNNNNNNISFARKPVTGTDYWRRRRDARAMCHMGDRDVSFKNSVVVAVVKRRRRRLDYRDEEGTNSTSVCVCQCSKKYINKLYTPLKVQMFKRKFARRYINPNTPAIPLCEPILPIFINGFDSAFLFSPDRFSNCLFPAPTTGRLS